MSHLHENVAYLRGLAEGLKLNENSKNAKLILNIIDTLEDFAEVIDEVLEEQRNLSEYIETIDEDLAEVEEDIYEDEDFEDDEDEEIDYLEIECPTCERTFYVDEDILYDDEDADKVICPNCEEVVDIDDLEIEYHEHEGCCCSHHFDDEDTCTVIEEDEE
ncbi:CD1247 N-terminal domain-containing protein [Serpentinicella alkaliphila]|uniref:AraC family transcriptional regulator n=1 Tax=Serpentinicella alkaliphila TaxID=1734049 RepID=A0A4R2TH40_9FIRM|nr:CD1247 N-terminal domain-containing protein [Serpentinicella alkaliphila]QUH26650.1 hypothetical protein HZR23_13575 [Serpentinicella alkaliphila]TCQ02880.1 hypothetical protein EDD79_10129 [Serpentinicella alkaliphila]